MNHRIITWLVMCCTALTFGQQLPQFTQYMYNTISINPAYAGSRQRLSGVGLHRSQWTGLENGPTTQTVSVHSPLHFDNAGVGLSFINDKLGYENFKYVYADGAYTINLNQDVKLAFGLKAGLTQYNLDQELILAESLDPTIASIQNKWELNFGAGLYLHTNQWYVGFSAPRLINRDKNNFTIDGIDYAVIDRVTYYLISGYVFQMNEDFKFKPSVLVKATNGAPLSFDVTGNFLFREKVWFGGSYRINEYTSALGGLIDFQLTEQFRLGYAYEYPLSDLNTYSSGTHEVLIIFEAGIDKRVKSPRYF